MNEIRLEPDADAFRQVAHLRYWASVLAFGFAVTSLFFLQGMARIASGALTLLGIAGLSRAQRNARMPEPVSFREDSISIGTLLLPRSSIRGFDFDRDRMCVRLQSDQGEILLEGPYRNVGLEELERIVLDWQDFGSSEANR